MYACGCWPRSGGLQGSQGVSSCCVYSPAMCTNAVECVAAALPEPLPEHADHNQFSCNPGPPPTHTSCGTIQLPHKAVSRQIVAVNVAMLTAAQICLLCVFVPYNLQLAPTAQLSQKICRLTGLKGNARPLTSLRTKMFDCPASTLQAGNVLDPVIIFVMIT